MKDAAILIESLEWEGEQLYGKALVLSSPAGEVVKGLLRDGAKVGLSSRGIGNIKESGEIEGYHLITWDVVGSPSSGHWANGVLESKSYALQNGMVVETTEVATTTLDIEMEPTDSSTSSPSSNPEEQFMDLLSVIKSKLTEEEYQAFKKALVSREISHERKISLVDEVIDHLRIAEEVDSDFPLWKEFFQVTLEVLPIMRLWRKNLLGQLS